MQRRPALQQISCLDVVGIRVSNLVRLTLPLIFLLLVIFTPPAASQETKKVTIREALRDQDQDFVPIHLGESVTLVGVLVSDPATVGPAASLVNLHDDTGGIVLFAPDTMSLVDHFHRGDFVEVQGKISQFKGQEQLIIERIRRLGTRPVPAPRDVLAADLHQERYEGQLVRVVGELVVPPDPLAKGNTTVIRDRSGEIAVYTYPRLFSNPKFTDRLMKGGGVEVVGVLGQYKEQPPFDSGYRLVPRDTDDFHFVPLPPYRAIGSFLALFLLGGLTLYLWWRRRSAERRAQEMAALTDNLRRSEEALRERTTYLNSLIENSPLAIVVHDSHNRVEMCNPAFERLFLYRQEEIVGAKLDELIKTKEAPSEPGEITQRVMAGEIVHVTTRRQRRDGTSVDVELHAVPLVVPGAAERAYGLYQDITTRKMLEDQLHQSQKMEAVGRLAGGVAHDFNNLLFVIRGHLDLLRQTVSPGDGQYRHVEQIQNASERAKSLIQQLLAYGRRQIVAPTVLNLNFVVTEIAKMLPRLIGEHIELATLTNAKQGEVKADRSQIEQVILNLAVNARDAMPKGGKLTIETANIALDEAYASRHASVQPGPYVMLAVSDTGGGMDAETESHIFEPFFTTKEKGKGTGLGLATVYGVVKQSGGNIWVYSEPGQGTTFKIYLPLVSKVVEEARVGQVPSEFHQGSGIVLLVEDEQAVRELVRDGLERNGYTVLEAKDGADAIRISQRHEGPIHLIVTDVVMPGMSGRELARCLASQRPKMKVLYMSGYTDDAIVHHGVLDPGTDFIQKPFTADDLARKVHDILHAKTNEVAHRF